MGFCNESSFDDFAEDLTTICSYLKRLDVKVGSLYKGTFGGQFVINLLEDDVTKTADNYLLAREAITHHFKQKDLVACFLPKA